MTHIFLPKRKLYKHNKKYEIVNKFRTVLSKNLAQKQLRGLIVPIFSKAISEYLFLIFFQNGFKNETFDLETLRV